MRPVENGGSKLLELTETGKANLLSNARNKVGARLFVPLQKELDIAISKHSVAWCVIFPSKGVFLKLLDSNITFMSEESFEAFHPSIAKVME